MSFRYSSVCLLKAFFRSLPKKGLPCLQGSLLIASAVVSEKPIGVTGFTPGLIEKSTGLVGFTTGLIEKSTGLIGFTTGLVGFTTGLIEKSVAPSEKSTGLTGKSVGLSDFTPKPCGKEDRGENNLRVIARIAGRFSSQNRGHRTCARIARASNVVAGFSPRPWSFWRTRLFGAAPIHSPGIRLTAQGVGVSRLRPRAVVRDRAAHLVGSKVRGAAGEIIIHAREPNS